MMRRAFETVAIDRLDRIGTLSFHLSSSTVSFLFRILTHRSLVNSCGKKAYSSVENSCLERPEVVSAPLSALD